MLNKYPHPGKKTLPWDPPTPNKPEKNFEATKNGHCFKHLTRSNQQIQVGFPTHIPVLKTWWYPYSKKNLQGLQGCITKTECQTEIKCLILFASLEGWRTLATSLSSYLVKIGVWTPQNPQTPQPVGGLNSHLPQPKVWLDDFGRLWVTI